MGSVDALGKCGEKETCQGGIVRYGGKNCNGFIISETHSMMGFLLRISVQVGHLCLGIALYS